MLESCSLSDVVDICTAARLKTINKHYNGDGESFLWDDLVTAVQQVRRMSHQEEK